MAVAGEVKGVNRVDSIFKNLREKERAIEFYKIADNKPGADCDDLISHSGYIRDELGDEEWAKLIEQKVKELEYEE